MKLCSSLIAAMLWCIAAYTQKTETFDIATYKIPVGWKKSIKVGVVNYSISDDAKKNYCIINVYASIVSGGTAAEEFSLQWQNLVAVPFGIKNAQQTDTALDEQGRKVITGAGGFVKSSLKGIAMLTVYVGFGRTTSILTLTNDKSYYKQIESFFRALTLAKTTAAKPVTLTPTNQEATIEGSGNIFHNTNRLEGVWNGININQNLNQLGMNHLAPNTPIWITFFDNGRVYNMLPDDFNTFNKNASDIGYYQISNGSAGLQWFKGTDVTKIDFIDKDRIRVRAATGDQIYSHCKPVDGMRLEGAWTTFANTKDPELDEPGIKPQIHFFKDGRFKDDGIFMTSFNEVKTQPGSGTYSLNNFMLTLKYDNGTTRRASFTGFISNDVSVNGRILFIDRHKFQKR
jgi:hypothetical protein